MSAVYFFILCNVWDRGKITYTFVMVKLMISSIGLLVVINSISNPRYLAWITSSYGYWLFLICMYLQIDSKTFVITLTMHTGYKKQRYKPKLKKIRDMGDWGLKYEMFYSHSSDSLKMAIAWSSTFSSLAGQPTGTRPFPRDLSSNWSGGCPSGRNSMMEGMDEQSFTVCK